MTSTPPVITITEIAKFLGLLVFSSLVAYVANYKLAMGDIPSLITGVSFFGVGAFAIVKLKGSPRELGVTFGLKILSVTAYKILNFLLSMWLIKDLKLSAEWSGMIIMIWGLFMTVCTIVSGSLTDVLGIRKTLLIGVSICALTRLVMAISDNTFVSLAFGLFPLAVGEALCTPVLVAALRLYSKPSQRTVAFSLFYGLMNFGFMLGYFVSDGVMSKMEGAETVTIPVIQSSMTPYGVLIAVSMIFDVLMLPLILFLKPGVQMTEAGFSDLPNHNHKTPDGLGLLARVQFIAVDAYRETLNTLMCLFRSKGFSKLVAFLLMIGLLKVVFNLMDYLLNPFVQREIGMHAIDKVGKLNATNSIMIVILAPLVGMLTRKYTSYSMVIFGGFITAFSFVFMSLPTSAFESVAAGWLGQAVGNEYLKIVGTVHPYFMMIFLWQVMFSIGEAFYSPRVYEYAASIAPQGQEASYSSLSYIPLLIGKISTGIAFSQLLNRYCPEDGPRNSGMMWTIIGLMVLVAPVGLLFLKRYIRVQEEGRGE